MPLKCKTNSYPQLDACYGVKHRSWNIAFLYDDDVALSDSNSVVHSDVVHEYAWLFAFLMSGISSSYVFSFITGFTPILKHYAPHKITE